MGFYMPTVISKTKSATPGKTSARPAKITKVVKTKKKKTSNKKRPPRAQVKVPSPGKPVLSDNNRKSYTMSNDNAG